MRKQAWLIVACCLLLLTPALSWAQHESTPTGDEHAAPAAGIEDARGEPGAHDKPALLQFDPGAAIWSIIIFLVLLAVLRAFAWKPILEVLKQREEFIQNSIDSAKREREEADKLLVKYQKQIDKAREDATAVVEEGKRDAEVVARRIQEEARKEGEEMIARAKREIGLARDAAVKDLYDQTAELAIKVAGQVVGKTLSEAEHRALVTESLERMKGSNEAKLN